MSRRKRILLLAILLLMMLGLSWAFLWTPLPRTSAITSMKAKFLDPATWSSVEFTVPPHHYEAILSALRPAYHDYFPAKWRLLGNLEITCTDGTTTQVWLFTVSDGAGAYAITGTWEGRSYFRGGTTNALLAALRAACQAKPE